MTTELHIHVGGAGFLSLVTVHFWAGYSFAYVWGAVRKVSSISGLYPLYARNTPSQLVTTKYVSGHCQKSPGGQNCPQFRTAGIERDVEECSLKGDDFLHLGGEIWGSFYFPLACSAFLNEQNTCIQVVNKTQMFSVLFHY